MKTTRGYRPAPQPPLALANLLATVRAGLDAGIGEQTKEATVE